MINNRKKMAAVLCAVQLLVTWGCSSEAPKQRLNSDMPIAKDDSSVYDEDHMDAFSLMDEGSVPVDDTLTTDGRPGTRPPRICVPTNMERVARAANSIMSRLDVDKNSLLSEGEFIKVDRGSRPAEWARQMESHRRVIFKKYSGEDKALSLDELKTMLLDRIVARCAKKDRPSSEAIQCAVPIPMPGGTCKITVEATFDNQVQLTCAVYECKAP